MRQNPSYPWSFSYFFSLTLCRQIQCPERQLLFQRQFLDHRTAAWSDGPLSANGGHATSLHNCCWIQCWHNPKESNASMIENFCRFDSSLTVGRLYCVYRLHCTPTAWSRLLLATWLLSIYDSFRSVSRFSVWVWQLHVPRGHVVSRSTVAALHLFVDPIYGVWPREVVVWCLAKPWNK